MSLDPILLRGSLHETIWGGQHLTTVAGKDLPPGKTIGESWETAVDSVALNGPYTGRSLGELTAEYGVRLYGSRAREVFGDRFPLLAKFLDAHAWLSVQVHPDDAYANLHEHGKLGKTEAWRILRTDPDAQIIHGLARATNRAEVAAAIRDARLEALTYKMPVKAGDVVINQAGTLHATGAGIVLYEIQEYSDVTYRLYDFGRVGPDGRPRELHIEKSLDVLSYLPLPIHTLHALSLIEETPTLASDKTREKLLVACRHFALAEVRADAARPFHHATDGRSCQIVTVIGGAARLIWGEDYREMALSLGQTAVIPAEQLDYQLHVMPGSPTAVALVSWVPSANNLVVRQWMELNS